MSSWADWAQALLAIYPRYVRPAGAFSMTTDNELCMLDTWARYSYTATGRIVDLGCWFGATTLALAQGVSGSAHAGKHPPIEAYDRFVWEDWMTYVARSLGVAWSFHAGADFLPVAQNLLRPYQSIVQLRRQDLLDADPGAEPIEFLFIDAMKSWPLADRIVWAFFPLLIPGRSLVVQQDFTWPAAVTATNHIVMWWLRDCLRPVYHVPGSTSVVYLVEAPIDVASLPIFTAKSFTPAQIDAAWEYSFRSVMPEGISGVWLCKIAFLVECGYTHSAHREATAFAAGGFRLPAFMISDVQRVIAERLGARLDPGEGELLRNSEQLLISSLA